MIGMGRDITKTPEMAQKVPISLPRPVVGAMSPYPTKYRVKTRHHDVRTCGHGDDDPVESVGDGGVLGVLLLPLDEVAEGGEEEPGDADEEDQQPKLLVTVLEGEGDGLETSGMSGGHRDYLT